jgi:hypothetical protein
MLAGAASGVLLPATVANAAEIEHLYEAQAIVTGQGESERARGFALGFVDVLVKVSGDPSLIGVPATASLAAEAGASISSFDYRDRMAGLPLHDEQGTRDRPYDLRMHFDPARVDSAIRTLGREPWGAARPRVAILLGVRDAETAYVLASDGARGLGQRQALAATAERRGLPIVLPDRAALERAGVSFAQLADADPAVADRLASAMSSDVALAGTLVWSEPALGWIAEWRMTWQGASHRWTERGVSFDDAFRDAIAGSERILSGHGAPER